MEISYKGLKKLTFDEVSIIQTLSQKYYNKFLRDFENPKLIVDIKKYDKEGNKAKYAISLRLEIPTIISSKQADWDLRRALHESFENLENAIHHKYKTEGQKPRILQKFKRL